jgi:hypothetical protein
MMEADTGEFCKLWRPFQQGQLGDGSPTTKAQVTTQTTTQNRIRLKGKQRKLLKIW